METGHGVTHGTRGSCSSACEDGPGDRRPQAPARPRRAEGGWPGCPPAPDGREPRPLMPAQRKGLHPTPTQPQVPWAGPGSQPRCSRGAAMGKEGAFQARSAGRAGAVGASPVGASEPLQQGARAYLVASHRAGPPPTQKSDCGLLTRAPDRKGKPPPPRSLSAVGFIIKAKIAKRLSPPMSRPPQSHPLCPVNVKTPFVWESPRSAHAKGENEGGGKRLRWCLCASWLHPGSGRPTWGWGRPTPLTVLFPGAAGRERRQRKRLRWPPLHPAEAGPQAGFCKNGLKRPQPRAPPAEQGRGRRPLWALRSEACGLPR